MGQIESEENVEAKSGSIEQLSEQKIEQKNEQKIDGTEKQCASDQNGQGRPDQNSDQTPDQTKKQTPDQPTDQSYESRPDQPSIQPTDQPNDQSPDQPTDAPPQKRIKNTPIFGSSFTTVTFNSLASKSTQTPSFLDTEEPTNESPQPAITTVEIPSPEHCSETGEEHESTIFQCRCKLYAFTEGEWKDRGVGTLKINVSSDSSTARLLMRNDAVKNIMLNARLFNKMPVVKKDQSKAVQFACIWGGEDKSMTNYLCKCSSEAVADELVQHIERLIPSE